jgi:hypothetical protein
MHQVRVSNLEVISDRAPQLVHFPAGLLVVMVVMVLMVVMVVMVA